MVPIRIFVTLFHSTLDGCILTNLRRSNIMDPHFATNSQTTATQIKFSTGAPPRSAPDRLHLLARSRQGSEAGAARRGCTQGFAGQLKEIRIYKFQILSQMKWSRMKSHLNMSAFNIAFRPRVIRDVLEARYSGAHATHLQCSEQHPKPCRNLPGTQYHQRHSCEQLFSSPQQPIFRLFQSARHLREKAGAQRMLRGLRGPSVAPRSSAPWFYPILTASHKSRWNCHWMHVRCYFLSGRGYYLPNTLLHIPSQDNIPIRLRSRDHIRLIVFAMSHNVCLNLRSSCQKYLATSWVAFGVFNTGERLGGISNAVEHNLGRWATKCGMDVWELLPHESHTILVPEPAVQIVDVARCVYCEGRERDSKLHTLGEFFCRQHPKLYMLAQLSHINGNRSSLTSSRYSAIPLILSCGTFSSHSSVDGVRWTKVSSGLSDASLHKWV